METDETAIKFDATVHKAGTLADNGIRVYLDLPEGSLEAFTKLVACQQHGIYLRVTAIPFAHENLTGLDNGSEKEAKESGSEVDSGRSIKQRDR